MREGSPEPTRPVWLTERQRDQLVRTIHSINGHQGLAAIVAAWDAAPADPLAALVANRNTLYESGLAELHGDLRALGMPVAALGGSQETTHMSQPLEVLTQAAIEAASIHAKKLREDGWDANLEVRQENAGERVVAIEVRLSVRVPIENVVSS